MLLAASLRSHIHVLFELSVWEDRHIHADETYPCFLKKTYHIMFTLTGSCCSFEEPSISRNLVNECTNQFGKELLQKILNRNLEQSLKNALLYHRSYWIFVIAYSNSETSSNKTYFDQHSPTHFLCHGILFELQDNKPLYQYSACRVIHRDIRVVILMPTATHREIRKVHCTIVPLNSP